MLQKQKHLCKTIFFGNPDYQIMSQELGQDVVLQSQKLYKMTSNNEIACWEITLHQDMMIRRYASSLTAKHIETTPEPCTQEQYQAQIDYQINRKGYRRTTPSKKPDLPMLAQEYDGQELSDFAYQPKLDGVRCIASNKGLLSRKNTFITSCPHINMITNLLPDGIKLDGELYVKKVGFQIINGMTRQFTATPKHYCLNYHVFDIIDTENNFHERILAVQDSIDQMYANFLLIQQMYEAHVPFNTQEAYRSFSIYSDKEFPIHLVPTTYSNNLNSISAKQLLQEHKDEYEGVIFRSLDTPYQLNQRSASLLKLKLFRDKEFEIIDIELRKNNTCVFVCRHISGERFCVTPDASNDRKRTIYVNKDRYIGKWLKVKYDSTTNAGIPRNAVGHETFTKEELNDDEPNDLC